MLDVGFEVLVVVVMLSIMFWLVTLCSLVEAKLGYLLGLLFNPDNGGSMFPQNICDILLGYMVRYYSSLAFLD
jgi:hypothetical protein